MDDGVGWVVRLLSEITVGPRTRHQMYVVCLTVREKPKLRDQCVQSCRIENDIKLLWKLSLIRTG
jgi:hypothetical protein